MAAKRKVRARTGTSRSAGGGPIRIEIPASVGFNLDKLEATVGNLAERLGCPKCFSGFECTFSRETRFAVDADTLKIETVPLPEWQPFPRQIPLPLIGTWPTPERGINVTIPDKVGNELKSFHKVVVNLAERLGCPNCFSGFDCTFSRESRFAVDEKTLRIDTVPLPE